MISKSVVLRSNVDFLIQSVLFFINIYIFDYLEPLMIPIILTSPNESE